MVLTDCTCDISDESPRLKHDAPGLLSIPVSDRDSLGSHFIITFKADPHLDRFAYLALLMAFSIFVPFG